MGRRQRSGLLMRLWPIASSYRDEVRSKRFAPSETVAGQSKHAKSHARKGKMTSKKLLSIAAVVLSAAGSAAHADTTLTIATVNNPDMVIMKKYSSTFEKATGIKLKWLVLEENQLRQRVTTDISTKGGQFDIITIGMYETPLWGKAKWLIPFDDTPASYDLNDVLPTVRAGLSYAGKLYALPFYAESTMTFYRTDLFRKAGLKMPDDSTWSEVAAFAARLNDKAHGIYGLCLRGQPGWGENMAIVGLLGNACGGDILFLCAPSRGSSRAGMMNGRTASVLARTALGWLVAVVMAFPVFWMALIAFKTELDAIASPPLLVFTPTLENFAEMQQRLDYFAHAWNSIAVAFGSTLLAVLVAAPAAYAMAFFPTRRTRGVLLWMLSTKFMRRPAC
jgi:ABC-type glycerol-3-phosphate transport system substrate-binding protein